MRFGSALLVVCLGIACDTIPLPSSNVPVNSCAGTGKGPCPQDPNQPARLCDSGACTVTLAGIFTLVVHLPSNNFSNPGLTFALSPEEIASLKPPPGGCAQDIGCLPLPAVDSVAGTLVVTPDIAAKYFASLGNGVRSVPGLVTFEPLWRSEAGGAIASAAQLGIALADTQATPNQNSPVIGPNDSPGVAFQALLQGTFDVGLAGYRMTLQPVPPFDSAFPPLLYGPELAPVVAPVGVTVPVPSDWLTGQGKQPLSVPPPLTPPITSLFPFASLPGAPSLAGFQAKIVRWPSGALLSNIITMSGDPSETHTFVTLVDLSAENAALIVDPPAGSVGLPSFVQAFVNGVTQAPQVPKLFDPVTVEGTVTRKDPITGEDVGTQASVVFDVGSDPSDPNNILAVDEPNPTQYFLTYRTSVRTDANGNYTVVLPPTQSPTFSGHYYDVWITPDDPTLATTKVTQKVGTSPSVQKGRSLGVSPRTHLTGQVVTFDGRPMPGAMIVADPSPTRFEPKSIATDYQTASLGWPREAMTTTDDSGNYDLLVEPGLIDLVVRPAAGSHYPWTVLRNHLVVVGVDASLDVTIPAPMHMHLVLTDDRNNAIPLALVSAYLSDGKAYRLVGQTTTLLPDTKSNPPVPSGSFELYLPPSFP